jgi:hypothetical protein
MSQLQATTSDCNGNLYFGPDAEESEEEQAADLTAWMADSQARGKARFLTRQRAELRAKAGRAASRVSFLEAELRAERFEEFRRYFRGRLTTERTVLESLNRKLDALTAGAE